jgi:hypothetical protein
VLTLGLAMLALTPAVPAHAPCWPAESRTVIATRQARVYIRHRRYHACSYRFGRRVRLMTPDLSALLNGVAVNRRYVVFGEERYCDISGCLYEVLERDLRSGRIRFHVINGVCPPTDEGDCGQAVIKRIYLRRDGAVAWLACPGSTSPPAEHENECSELYWHSVMVRDARGDRELDRGHIHAPSLRVTHHGHRVQWIRRGVRRSARIY